MASVALSTGQPVGHLLDLLGLPREWPEVFDVMRDMLDERRQDANHDAIRARLDKLAREH